MHGLPIVVPVAGLTVTPLADDWAPPAPEEVQTPATTPATIVPSGRQVMAEREDAQADSRQGVANPSMNRPMVPCDIAGMHGLTLVVRVAGPTVTILATVMAPGLMARTACPLSFQ